MKIVYFDPALSEMAPHLLGVFCANPDGQWLTLRDIMDVLESGENVEIRQASQSERERAEGIVILYGIELQLAEQFGGLLDSSEASDFDLASQIASAFTVRSKGPWRDSHPAAPTVPNPLSGSGKYGALRAKDIHAVAEAILEGAE